MLNTKALAASASAPKVYVEDVFSTYLYTGTGSTQTITNGIDLSGKGGLVWIKSRNNTVQHVLTDTARGANKLLYSNLTNAEVNNQWGVNSFNASGFTVINADAVNNANGDIYTSWTFRKAAKFFDVVTYTGTGANRTISHNLGSVPGCIIVKRTDTAADWQVYHRSLANTEYLVLNDTAAKATGTTRWNSTTPTSTEFSLGTDTTVNANGGTYVAYLFAHDAGGFGDSGNDNVISCGSCTGTSTVSLGWEPQWILFKRATGGVGNWFILDNMRGFAPNQYLSANTTSDEISSSGVDINATGFSLSGFSTGTYIYIAIRRGPMKTPTDATKVFSSNLRTDSGSEVTLSPGFAPDTVIDLSRPTYSSNFFYDRLRGKDKYLASNSTGAEGTLDYVQFDKATGTYSIKSVTAGPINFVDYAFRRAPGFFDVVAYTGTGSARTVSHNLGVVPELMVVKSRNNGGDWSTWTAALGLDGQLLLNKTNASQTLANYWSGLPGSSSFSVSSIGYSDNNGNGITYIAYLFATCPGVSKVGSYTGTGTTKQIDCGFTNGARFVLIKRTDSTGDWYVWDTARGIVSGNDPFLLLNSTAAEVTNTDYIDPLSSGFEISSTAPAAINANGGSYIYLSVA